MPAAKKPRLRLDGQPYGKPGPKPKITYDETTLEQIRALGKIQCTIKEAAAVLKSSKAGLIAFFESYPDAREVFESGREEGKASLRRRQFQMAEKNPTMSIWLGKQYLEQRDVSQINQNMTITLSDVELDRQLTALLSKAGASSDDATVH